MNNKPIDTVSNRIKLAMELQGLRQVDIVERTGLSKALVNHYVSGRVDNAKTDKIYTLAKALNVDPVWLMGMDVPMRPKEDDVLTIVERIKEDKPLMQALQKYVKATDETKGKVITVMNALLDL